MHATINCCMHPEVFKIWIQVLNCNGACAASRNQQVLEKTTCCAAGFRLHTWKMLPLMNFMQIWQLFVSLLSWQSVGSLWLDHQGPFLYWQKHEAASSIYFTLSLWHIEDSQPDLETRTLDLLLLNSERTTWGKLWAKTYFFFLQIMQNFLSQFRTRWTRTGLPPLFYDKAFIRDQCLVPCPSISSLVKSSLHPSPQPPGPLNITSPSTLSLIENYAWLQRNYFTLRLWFRWSSWNFTCGGCGDCAFDPAGTDLYRLDSIGVVGASVKAEMSLDD